MIDSWMPRQLEAGLVAMYSSLSDRNTSTMKSDPGRPAAWVSAAGAADSAAATTADGRRADGRGKAGGTPTLVAARASGATAPAAPATATLVKNLRRSTLGARAIDFSLKSLSVSRSASWARPVVSGEQLITPAVAPHQPLRHAGGKANANQSVRPGSPPAVGKVVGIGDGAARRFLVGQDFVGDPFAFAIRDRFLLATELQPHLLAHVAGTGPAHQRLDLTRLFGREIERPGLGVGLAGLHRGFGRLVDAWKHDKCCVHFVMRSTHTLRPLLNFCRLMSGRGSRI